MAVRYTAGEAAALIFSEKLLDSDEEVSDIEENIAFPLPVDIGETDDKDGTTASVSNILLSVASRSPLPSDNSSPLKCFAPTTSGN